jgi:hypothetical protein
LKGSSRVSSVNVLEKSEILRLFSEKDVLRDSKCVQEHDNLIIKAAKSVRLSYVSLLLTKEGGIQDLGIVYSSETVVWRILELPHRCSELNLYLPSQCRI